MEKWNRLLVLTATILLMVAFIAVTVRLGAYIHHTLLLFALGGLVAYALSPLVERLGRTRLSRPLSVGIVFLGLFALIGLGAWFLEGKIMAQAQDIQQNFPHYKQLALDKAQVVDQKLSRLSGNVSAKMPCRFCAARLPMWPNR